MRPAPLFFVGLIALMLAAASASAQTPASSAPPAQKTRAPHPALLHVTVDLDFKLGPGLCPGGEAFVHQEVSRRLGWDPFEPMPDGVPGGRIDSVIARAPGGLIANFEHIDAAGVRQWNVTYHELGAGPQACERLIRSIAIEIVGGLTDLAFPPVEPEPAPGPPSPPPAPPPPEQPPPAVVAPVAPPSPPPLSPPPPGSSLHPRPEVGLAGFVSFGVGPHPTFGAALHLGVAITPFGVDGARLVLAGELRVDAPVTEVRGVQTQLFAGSLVACGSKDLARGSTVSLGLLGCVVGTAGALRSSWPTLDGYHSMSAAYGALGGRLGFVARVASLLLVLPQIEILPTLADPHVSPQRHEVSVGSVTGTAGVGATLPF